MKIILIAVFVIVVLFSVWMIFKIKNFGNDRTDFFRRHGIDQ